MSREWISLQSIPVGGSIFRFDDQLLWEEPIKEFGLDCRIIEPLRAEVSVLPQEQGILFRGTISGKVAMPCNRCSEDSIITIRHTFESFEPLPDDPFRAQETAEDTALAEEVDEAVIRSVPPIGNIEINPGALVWEEFSLSLPVNPLCGKDCKGLCPSCGCNRNTEHCACKGSEGDPRLAALRGLKIGKKK